MKKILLFAFTMAFYGIAVAQLRLTEQFDNPPFTVSGNLGTQNSWVQNGSGTDVQIAFASDNTGALTYPKYTSGKSYISVGRTNGIDPHKVFNTSVPTTANTTFFISFVVRVPSSSTVATTSNAEYSVSLRNTANTSFLSRFFIGKDASNNIEFGISCGQGAGNAVWTNGNYAVNTTYLIVIRYDVVTGGTNDDDMWLWVNPSLISEPSTGASTVAQINGTEATYSSAVNSLMIHQRHNSNSPVAHFDAFRVAIGTGMGSTTGNASAAWSNLSPQGAPLPVKFGNIMGYEKSAGVQIDWTAYSEENVAQYIVERSADGQHFSEVGTVAARNNASEIQYGFFDANPLAGYNFYRLRNVDIDGKNGYSNIIRVDLTKGGKDITVYPNPVRGGNISYGSAQLAKGNYTVRIINAGGQQVFTQRFSHTGGAINQSVQLPASLNSGFYTLLLENEGAKVAAKTFMVQ